MWETTLADLVISASLHGLLNLLDGEQVDILISKNQVLQTIYLKHHVSIAMKPASQIVTDKKPNEIHNI